jgi:UDP-N-acetylglucosamine 2-epimerase (non-hydrolysing)
MKIAIIVGTRPEIIKMSPILRECEKLDLDYFVLHTGQHYSYNMDKVFFKQLELSQPKYNLSIGSGTHAQETSKILIGTEKVLQEEKPDVVLVEGDTNTVLGGALAAVKIEIKVGHVEAGLRSYDRRMPEEINRILTDHCADYLFAPTQKAKNILLGEGVKDDHIFVTGNTIVDAVVQNLQIAKKNASVLQSLGLRRKDYFLVTIHRQENVDDKTNFHQIIEGLQRLSDIYDIPIVYPIHPRAKKQMKQFQLKANTIKIIEPLDFLKFLELEHNAKLVLTDSGGVQEETCILGVPCVTLRNNTERPETLDVGSNILSGIHPKKVVHAVDQWETKNKVWENPFGKGTSGKMIIKILQEIIQ